MKIVKLLREDFARWRENLTHLVDDTGTVQKLMPPGQLEKTVSAVVRQAKQQGKSQEQTFNIGAEQHTIAVKLKRTGSGQSEFLVEVRIDGLRPISGRDIIAAEKLALHGECQLRHPNNTILKIVRDPRTHRPTFKESMQVAPKPENCPCKEWGRPHPGVHYATCQWNRLAPPEEQAPVGPTEQELRELPKAAFPSLAIGQVVVSRPDPGTAIIESDPLDSPEKCRNGCLGWATPKGQPIPEGQHHPTCYFAARWAAKTRKTVERWLVDLRSGQKVRPASDKEVGDSDIAKERTGSPVIHVDSVPYAVMTVAELAEMGEQEPGTAAQ